MTDEREVELLLKINNLEQENSNLTTNLNSANSLILEQKLTIKTLKQKLDTKTDRDLKNEKESKRLNDLQENLKAQQKSLNQEKQDVAGTKRFMEGIIQQRVEKELEKERNNTEVHTHVQVIPKEKSWWDKFLDKHMAMSSDWRWTFFILSVALLMVILVHKGIIPHF